MSTANTAWVVAMVAMTIAFITFFAFSANRRSGLLVCALSAAAVAVLASLTAALLQ